MMNNETKYPASFAEKQIERDNRAEARAQVKELDAKELAKHAAVSRTHRCGCGTCFCCLCLAEEANRHRNTEAQRAQAWRNVAEL